MSRAAVPIVSSPLHPRPQPGVPYTLFLRHGRYTPREQRALARLGFTFGTADATGQVAPSQTGVALPDLPLSDLLALLQPLHLTFSVTRARHWYGERLRAADIFWYLCLHHDEDV
jgi:hypothetical protein